jgi:hypothetical protein
MQNDLVTPESVSKEKLKAALDAAFIDAAFDSDGDLLIKDEIRCFAFLNEKRDRIRLFSQFGTKEGAPELEQLQLANDINNQYRVVRAYVKLESQSLCFDFEILLNGGVTMKNFVLSVKRFCSIPREAIKDLDKNGVVE